MLCESRVINQNPKYRIIKYNNEYFMVDLVSTWIAYFLPMINWFIPKKYAKISIEEFESLKLQHESLVKNYEDIKSKNDKLTIENKDLSKKIKDNEANSQIAVTQMSFDTIGDNNLKDEILNLDLLNMTPLDAINALYSLQKKAKNN